MSANNFGQHFQVTSFGESHGLALGAIIEGCPAGVRYDESILAELLYRRRPGLSAATSSRQETDNPEILSGVFEGQTLGTPICVLIRNQDARSRDYDEIKSEPRVGHADDVWVDKFGHSDHRGGGRSSGRETLSRVIGGAFAKMFLNSVCPDLDVHTHAKQVGSIVHDKDDFDPHGEWGLEAEFSSALREFLTQAKVEGQSYGGIAEVHIRNAPKNLGQPVFHKLKSDLAAAMMSIGAVTGFDMGEGFDSVHLKGTEFHSAHDSKVYGGIRGGISTGEPISLRVAFKPTSSILDIAKKGRHDPCVMLRALPVLEAMTFLVLADHVLWSRLDRV
ncbi:MAG: chorismate synthase [Bdellovibrionales bacterium]|nr:chorismate synthase [Bdellovibrionales bacterium]